MVVDSVQVYDDFLGLASLDLRAVRLLVFYGVSGSGKSSAMRFLVHQHPHLRNRPSVFLARLERGAPIAMGGGQVVLVDEVWNVRQFPELARLLARSHTVLVASHVKPRLYAPFRFVWRTRSFVMDRCREKMARYLAVRNIPFSPAAVDRYCRMYGANYVDIRHILDRYPDTGFDEAFARFQKFCSIQQVPDRRTPRAARCANMSSGQPGSETYLGDR